VASRGPGGVHAQVSQIVDRHFEQARRNRDLAEELLTTGGQSATHVQWAVIAAFYCAVHCIQGYLIDRGRDPRSHMARGNEIADPSNHVPLQVQRDYEALKQLSERARYRLGAFDPAYVRSAILDKRLKSVTDFVGL
jgi:HEPN domain-containing protein